MENNHTHTHKKKKKKKSKKSKKENKKSKPVSHPRRGKTKTKNKQFHAQERKKKIGNEELVQSLMQLFLFHLFFPQNWGDRVLLGQERKNLGSTNFPSFLSLQQNTCKHKISQLQKIKQLKRNMVCKYKFVLMNNEYNLYFNSFTKEYCLILSSLNLTRTRDLLDFGWKMN